jgi:hypothetical protein
MRALSEVGLSTGQHIGPAMWANGQVATRLKLAGGTPVQIGLDEIYLHIKPAMGTPLCNGLEAFASGAELPEATIFQKTALAQTNAVSASGAPCFGTYSFRLEFDMLTAVGT